MGKLCLPVLLDSGFVRSLISFNHFQQLSLVDATLQILTTDLASLTASEQSLETVGQVKVLLKILRFRGPGCS